MEGSFNLLSEVASDAPIQYSSPVQETDKLKELRLERENKLLLQSRSSLLKEIEDLQRQWNDLQALDDRNANEGDEEDDEEDELIFNLILEKAETDNTKKSQEMLQESEETDHEGDKVEFDSEKYSTRPLRDWKLRIEYLKKFYPYLSINGAKSRLSLETDKRKKSMLIKTISFEINYANIFIFDVAVRLYSKENVYHVWKLEIIKRSNNKFNTILIQMQLHFTKTKNINGFLYSVNTLYELLITRQKTIDELNTKFYADKGRKPNVALHTNEFSYESVSMSWDLIFDHGELYPLVTVNSAFNAVFADMVDLYGVQKAVVTLIESIRSSNNN